MSAVLAFLPMAIGLACLCAGTLLSGLLAYRKGGRARLVKIQANLLIIGVAFWFFAPKDGPILSILIAYAGLIAACAGFFWRSGRLAGRVMAAGWLSVIGASAWNLWAEYGPQEALRHYEIMLALLVFSAATFAVAALWERRADVRLGEGA